MNGKHCRFKDLEKGPFSYYMDNHAKAFSNCTKLCTKCLSVKCLKHTTYLKIIFVSYTAESMYVLSSSSTFDILVGEFENYVRK
jgi:hypothetical protein